MKVTIIRTLSTLIFFVCGNGLACYDFHYEQPLQYKGIYLIIPSEASELAQHCKRKPIRFSESWKVTPEQAVIMSKWITRYLKRKQLNLDFSLPGNSSVQYVGFTTENDKLIYGNVFPTSAVNKNIHSPVVSCTSSKAFWSFQYSLKDMNFVSIESNGETDTAY